MAEVDVDRMGIQGRMGASALERCRVDVGAADELRATRPGDAGQDPGARPDIENVLWMPLPTERVDHGGTQACRRVRSIPEHRRGAWRRGELGERDAALLGRWWGGI